MCGGATQVGNTGTLHTLGRNDHVYFRVFVMCDCLVVSPLSDCVNPECPLDTLKVLSYSRQMVYVTHRRGYVVLHEATSCCIARMTCSVLLDLRGGQFNICAEERLQSTMQWEGDSDEDASMQCASARGP